MNLIDEENDIPAGADLFEHLLEAFFEITAVARTGDKCAKIKCVDLLIFQSLWYIAFNN